MSQETGVVERFGKYQLLRKIGHGGMAEVFLARSDDDPPDTPPIVVKRLHLELESDRDAVDLFLTEADVTLLLSHPNIVKVHDSGEVDGRYYIAMEYVSGKTLDQVVGRFATKRLIMEPECAVHIVVEVLRGLEYVHSAKAVSGRPLGVIHRDITPSNIFITGTGSIKLGDFGVAKLVGVESWTMSGSIKGKLGYLSPEQVTGLPPTHTIDLWAVGVILYELTAGERLFVGENELDVMLRIRDAKVPDVRKANKDVPKPLAKIIEQSLHKKERKRFANADEFRAALEMYRSSFKTTYGPEALVAYLTRTLA